MPQPPRFRANDFWLPNWGKDTAKYLINPGSVRFDEGKHTIKEDPGDLQHIRPYLFNGYTLFVFPVGVEEFRVSGDTTLGLYKYIGDNDVDGVITHYEEGRITLSGTLPGITAQDNMVNLRNMLRSPAKTPPGLTLYAQGVFENQNYVVPESWEFSHDRDDRSHSIEYTITFVRIGDKHRMADPSGGPPPLPGGKSKPKGKTHRVVVVKTGMRTLKAIAKAKYHNVNRWTLLVPLNTRQVNEWKRKHPDARPYSIATYKWPMGTKFYY